MDLDGGGGVFGDVHEAACVGNEASAQDSQVGSDGNQTVLQLRVQLGAVLLRGAHLTRALPSEVFSARGVAPHSRWSTRVLNSSPAAVEGGMVGGGRRRRAARTEAVCRGVRLFPLTKWPDTWNISHSNLET